MRHVFPQTNVNEVRQRVSALSLSLASFADMKVEERSKEIFRIAPVSRNGG